MNEDAFTKLDQLLESVRRHSPTTDNFLDGGIAAGDAKLAQFSVEAKKVDDQVWALLTETLPPDRMRSLMGCHLILNGADALVNPRLCIFIGISEADRKEMLVLLSKERQRRRLALTSVAKNVSDVKRDDLNLDELAVTSAIMTKLQEKQKSRIDEMLTAGRLVLPNFRRYSFGW